MMGSVGQELSLSFYVLFLVQSHNSEAALGPSRLHLVQKLMFLQNAQARQLSGLHELTSLHCGPSNENYAAVPNHLSNNTRRGRGLAPHPFMHFYSLLVQVWCPT